MSRGGRPGVAVRLERCLGGAGTAQLSSRGESERKAALLAEDFGVGGRGGDSDQARAVEEEIDFVVVGFDAELV